MSAITAIEKFVAPVRAMFAKAPPAAAPAAGRVAYRRTTSSLTFDGWMPRKDPVARKAGVGLEQYAELLADAQCGGAVDSRAAATLSQSWYLDMSEVSDGDALAKEVDAAFKKRLPIYQTISEMLNAPLYGVQDTEVIWPSPGETGPYVLPVGAIGLPAWWLDYTTDGERMLKTDMLQKIPLPPRKFITLQYKGTIDNPHGQPVLSRCYWPVYFKKAAIKLLAVAEERFGLPWTEMKFPLTYDEEMMTKFVQRAAEMQQDGVIGMPEDVAMRILQSSSGSNGADLFLGMIAWSNSEIAKAVLGHSGGIDATAGKLGPDTTAMDIRADIVQADRELVQSGMNQIIDWIYEINDPNAVGRPRFKFYQKEDYDQPRVERDKGLYSMGVRFTSQYIRSAYSFEEGDFFLLENPPVLDPNAETAKPGSDPRDGLRVSIGGSGQTKDTLKDYRAGTLAREQALAFLTDTLGYDATAAERMLGPVPPPVDPNAPAADPAATPPASFAAPSPTEEEAETMTPEELAALEEKIAGPVIAAVESGANVEEALAALAKIYPELDGSVFVERLAHRMFLERLRGELSEDDA